MRRVIRDDWKLAPLQLMSSVILMWKIALRLNSSQMPISDSGSFSNCVSLVFEM